MTHTPAADDPGGVLPPDDPWDAPWAVKVRPGSSRAMIIDAAGYKIIAGMNIGKAAFIVSAVNCRADLLAAAIKVVASSHQLQNGQNDTPEGFSLVDLSAVLELCAVIAKARGKK